MKTTLPAILLTVALLAAPACAQPQQGPQLVLTGVGRFAVLADLSTLSREGDRVRMRSLQVTEEDFQAGGQTYWGGWSWWAFDCAARTADRLDFASVREGGAEGPTTPDPSPAYAAAPGGDAAELLAVACDPASAGEADADNLADAVRVGRAALAANQVKSTFSRRGPLPLPSRHSGAVTGAAGNRTRNPGVWTPSLTGLQTVESSPLGSGFAARPRNDGLEGR